MYFYAFKKIQIPAFYGGDFLKLKMDQKCAAADAGSFNDFRNTDFLQTLFLTSERKVYAIFSFVVLTIR